jgi:hypothetical protein
MRRGCNRRRNTWGIVNLLVAAWVVEASAAAAGTNHSNRGTVELSSRASLPGDVVFDGVVQAFFTRSSYDQVLAAMPLRTYSGSRRSVWQLHTVIRGPGPLTRNQRPISYTWTYAGDTRGSGSGRIRPRPAANGQRRKRHARRRQSTTFAVRSAMPTETSRSWATSLKRGWFGMSLEA